MAATTESGAMRPGAGLQPSAAPVVLDVNHLSKRFRIPDRRIDSLKERLVHPLARVHYRELDALREVSFDVRRGEFFGVVGRNGSGKSTLLKILSSIYRADAGRVRIAGRLAPFIELGVGFNPELTSRENVVLNGVMMGLSRAEAQRRLEAVLEFAELEDFADLKLKNYSSGMMVRLAFAVMVQADADTMLIDEVLAVGDAAFAQKCNNVFREKRAAGKTIVLVTHDMSAVQAFCDRAMLLHDGECMYVGDPEEAALRYYRLNFETPRSAGAGPAGVPDVNVQVRDAWIENRRGERVTSIEQGEPIGFNVLLEARQELLRPVFAFHVRNADGHEVFGFNRTLEVADPAQDRVGSGERVRIAGPIENPLLPGRYFVDALVARNRTQGDWALHPVRLLDFIVYGTEPGFGNVSVRTDVKATIEQEGGLR